MARIGIFSGTFDPVHEGHVLFALTAFEQFGLDEVALMPEPKPRRKNGVTPLMKREAMLALVCREHPQLKLIKTDDHDEHTVSETMTLVRKNYSDNTAFALLMGADVFEHLPQWPDHDQLLHDAAFIVALLTEDDGEIAIPLAQQLGADAEFLPAPLSSISSSKIRDSIANGQPGKGLNDDVADYITEHHLYS